MSQSENGEFFLGYQLRYAAGIFWLLAMEQKGEPYIRPLPISKMGAEIWELLAEGKSFSGITERIAQEYGIGKEEVSEDVAAFLEQLQEKGILEEARKKKITG